MEGNLKSSVKWADNWSENNEVSLVTNIQLTFVKYKIRIEWKNLRTFTAWFISNDSVFEEKSRSNKLQITQLSGRNIFLYGFKKPLWI